MMEVEVNGLETRLGAWPAKDRKANEAEFVALRAAVRAADAARRGDHDSVVEVLSALGTEMHHSHSTLAQQHAADAERSAQRHLAQTEQLAVLSRADARHALVLSEVQEAQRGARLEGMRARARHTQALAALQEAQQHDRCALTQQLEALSTKHDKSSDNRMRAIGRYTREAVEERTRDRDALTQQLAALRNEMREDHAAAMARVVDLDGAVEGLKGVHRAIWEFAPFGYLWIWLDMSGYGWI
jgi:hypothetical protein